MPPAPPMQREAIGRTIIAVLTIRAVRTVAAVVALVLLRRLLLWWLLLRLLLMRLAAATGDE